MKDLTFSLVMADHFWEEPAMVPVGNVNTNAGFIEEFTVSLAVVQVRDGRDSGPLLEGQFLAVHFLPSPAAQL